MYPLVFVLLVAALGSPGAHSDPVQSSAATCIEWEECRDLALAARDAGEAETFHDLAWRAVQTRRRRDPDLLFLLARAQSLSGRPHDALITLQRLATEFGVAHDVSADEDFRRVRALPGWADLQALIARVESGTPAAAPEPAASTTGAAVSRDAPGSRTEKKVREVTSDTVEAAPTTTPKSRFEEAARFSAPRFAPGGLAYDAVSRRFVVGNLPERKLTIVAQGSNRAATLAGDAAGFRGVRAIEIDRGSGDLWVVSGESGTGDARSSELHKLQLVSGRVLKVYTPAPDLGASRLVDVAVARSTGVIVLDVEGPRLLRPGRDGETLAHAVDLPEGTATSLAAAKDGRSVYVAYRDGLIRVDLSAGSTTRMTANAKSDLAGLTRVRAHGNTLIGLRETGEGAQLLRLGLARNGARVLKVETLDTFAAAGMPLALDVLENEVFYLVPEVPEAVIRRIELK